MISSQLRRNIIMTLSRQLLAACAQFLLVVLIARELGPQGNGFYAIAVLIPSMLTNFLNLGVGPATVYHISRRDFDLHQVFSGNLRLAFAVASIGVICALPALAVWGGELFPGIPQDLLYLGLACFPLSLLLAYLSTILQGLENFKAFNLAILLPPYVNLAGVIIVLYILHLGILAAMIAYIAGQMAALLAVFVLLHRCKTTRHLINQSTSFSAYTRKTLGYGWKAHLSNILAFVNYRSDIFLVNFFLTPAATGIYVIAVQIAEKLWMLSQAASTVLLPRLSAMHETPKDRLALTTKSFLIVSGLTTLAGLVAVFLLSWLLCPVFGEEYAGALPAFLWLLPGIVAGAGSRIQANCIAASGKPEWNMYVAVWVVTINIFSNILLIPKFGIVGAAGATSIAYCFNAMTKNWLVKKTVTT